MNKKVGVLLIVLFGLFLLSNRVLAEAPGGLDPDALQNDSAVRIVTGIQEAADEKKWEYLSEKWQEILLKNKGISMIDSFLKKINFVFVFVFGQDYSLSLTLLFVILMWIFFFVMFYRSIAAFSTFSDGVSLVIGLCLTVILSHLKVYYGLATILFKVIFFREGVWGWVAVGLFLLGWFVALAFMRKIIYKIGLKTKKTREEQEKWKEKFAREAFQERVKNVEHAFDEVEEGFSS